VNLYFTISQIQIPLAAFSMLALPSAAITNGTSAAGGGVHGGARSFPKIGLFQLQPSKIG
jgi:hypothetical protein